MFPTSNCGPESVIYDFENHENSSKWKKIFTAPLQKVLKNVHPNLKAKDEALDYIESLILRLLAMLCAPPYPHTVQDVEDRVLRIFPNPIDKWAIGDAQAALEKGKKKTNLLLPVDRVHALLRDTLPTKIDYQVSFYVVAVLEYVSADILKLAGYYVLNIKVYEVSQQDIRIAMCADEVLMDMFHEDNDNDDPLLGPMLEEPSSMVDGSLTYDELIKDLIMEEKTYIRELNMIIKVFKDKLQQVSYIEGLLGKKYIDVIFSNIMEIREFAVYLLGSLEDTLEGTKEDELPNIGICFEELAEGAEFDVYDKYGTDVLNPECIDTLLMVVGKTDVSHALTTAGHGFKEAVKYYLPRLILAPIIHMFKYFKYIELLLNAAIDDETKESLEQVTGLLFPLQNQLDRAIQSSPYNSYLRRKLGEISIKQGMISRKLTLHRLNDLQKSIDGWEGKDIAQCCSEYILDGDLKFGPTGKKQSERHVFLFDGLIVLCKFKMGDYKFKEKFMMRMVEIVDREDAEEMKHSFEIKPRDQPPVILSAKSNEEKNNWMAALIMLNTRSMLERTLDSILLDEEKQHPLRLPDPSIYSFSEPDSEENIVIEERENSATPLIRGAKLIKLVERLTYHMYADPMFVKTFLTTFRSFCTPMELLDHIILRFHIPEPAPSDSSEDDPPELKTQKITVQREILKRFRKEYSQPVQFRVLNVLRHWVDYHFYDYEDKVLLEKLMTFLDTVQAKSMKKWVESITKIIQRKQCNEEPREITFSHNKSPPSPISHIPMDDNDWKLSLPPSTDAIFIEPDFVRPLLMLHPIEIARQLTLLDFEYYRAVKPSELVGTAWMKDGKEKRAPNLLRMISHTNNINNWLQRCIVETENFEERVSILYRIVEIFVMLFDLNNFSGVFQLSAMLDSAAVHRLELTKSEVKRRLPPYQLRMYDEAMDLGRNHFKKYLERLRSINPPCVPFFGMYLTNILHIEIGNPDFLQKSAEGLINFNKRRKVAEITGEIQQYQNQPYCLESDAKIHKFLQNLRPFRNYNEHQIANYLYDKSNEIEPKNCKKALVKERRWPTIVLKSPGIKPRSSRSVPNPLPSMFGSGRKASDGTEGDSTPQHLTPPTPSTPGTPPSSANQADNSIFAPVEIGSSAFLCRQDNRGSISNASTVSTMIGSFFSVPPTPISANPPAPVPPHTPLPASAMPPPLPPRRRRETSLGDTSPKVKQVQGAPQLPPRDASPPPIPPRVSTATLPRMHAAASLSSHLNMSGQPPPPYPIPSHLHYHPFMGAPPHLQYRLDPPPQRRKTISVDLSTSGPKNASLTLLGQAPITEAALESPPTPPPRLVPRQPTSFSYDHHN